MAVGSGLGSQLGIGKESAWGTAVAATAFIPVSGFDVKHEGSKVQGQGIRPGGLMPLGSLYSETNKGAKVSASFEVPTTGLDFIFENLTGSSPTPSLVTDLYTATFALADNYGKGLTVQGGVPEVDGTVQVHEAVGCKVESIEFSCSVGGLLTCSVQFDGKEVTVGTTGLDSASFADPLGVFPWNAGDFQVGTYGAEATLAGVREFSIRFARSYDAERYTLGGAATKQEQITNAFVEVSGSVTVDLIDTAAINYVLNDTDLSLIIPFATNLGDTDDHAIEFHVPSIRFQEYGAPVNGPDTIKQTLSFMGKDDGTHAGFSIVRVDGDNALG